MNVTDLKSLLIERGYKDHSAQVAAQNLSTIDKALQPLLDKWIHDENSQENYTEQGYSINEFQKEYGMKYPAALLTIDWIIKEPEIAIKCIKEGIK
jgi:hypothetical protein